MASFIDLTGQRYGKLICLRRVADKNGQVCWLCKCECGEEVVLRRSQLRRKGGGSKECKACWHKRLAQLHRKDPAESAKTQRYYHYKGGAKKRGREWKISKERFNELISRPCHYCKQEWSMEWNNLKHNGIDRIDNNKGYTSKNLVACCTTCNFGKNSLSLEEFKVWLTKVAANLPNF
jgi:hypothetical protein